MYLKIVFIITTFTTVKTLTIKHTKVNKESVNDKIFGNNGTDNNKLNEVFRGVYIDCVLNLSYSCLQKRTLIYLDELNKMSEVSIVGNFIKFVKLNKTELEESVDLTPVDDTNELGFLIDKAIDKFFNSHILKFNALGRDITIPNNVEEFVGRKKRKGGGGGHGGDDGGKKKMMMMAMMCMKMKLMMMVPAMMGMMGMMSFKGMMFSMMSFMISKMMLLMKLLEKKGGGGFGGGGTGADGGWAAAGGGGGAWMPAGGQDFGGGGYDANAQWQSRSILEKLESKVKEPIITYVIPAVTYANKDKKLTIDEVKRDNDYGKPKRRKRGVVDKIKNNDFSINVNNLTNNNKFYLKSKLNVNGSEEYGMLSILSEIIKKYLNIYEEPQIADRNLTSESDSINMDKMKTESRGLDTLIKNEKSKGSNEKKNRTKRSLLDIIQNSYTYWMTKLLGIGNNRRTYVNPKYKIINGLKYVYYPMRPVFQQKTPKEIQTSNKLKTVDEGFKPIIAAEDFNKGEILEASESRMNRKKFNKMKSTVNDTMDDNPWE